jgi:putative salt-induced outer membrane protein YdiY
MTLNLFNCQRAGLLFAVFLATGIQAQTIVNTETLLAQVDSGWAATFGVVGDLSFGNSRVTDLSSDGSVGYTRGYMTYRFAASWARLAENGAAIQDNRFAQVRINRKLGERGWRAFVFLQTASNNVLLMQERTLLGAGIRKRVLDGDGGWLDVGWGPFSEREVYEAETADPQKNLLRSSITMASEWQVTERLDWRNTIYLQSDMGAWNDHRFYYESAANMTISEQLSFEFSLVYRRDNDPHAGLEPVDLGTAFGLRWEME